jgi:hypothetical protein
LKGFYQKKQNKAEVRNIPINKMTLKYPNEKSKTEGQVFAINNRQKYNQALKDLFNVSGLDRMIVKVRYSGKKRIEIRRLLYEEIASHRSRATFTTLVRNSGVSAT